MEKYSARIHAKKGENVCECVRGRGGVVKNYYKAMYFHHNNNFFGKILKMWLQNIAFCYPILTCWKILDKIERNV